MADDPQFDYLEGRVEEQSRDWDRLHEQIGRLDQKIENVGTTLSARIDGKIDALDQKLDRKIDDLRSELSKQFRWTIGTMWSLL